MERLITGFGLECKKAKRTGIIPLYLAGGILAAAFPVLNMAVRCELFTGLKEPPVKILLDANWQMMAMMNILLTVTGACLMYHEEYADHALQKMCTLPFRESRMFFGKTVFMAVLCMLTLLIEAAAVLFCGVHWFAKPWESLAAEIWKNFGWSFLLMIPAVIVSLSISSACQNMWISLGTGVTGVFIAVLLPAGSFVPSLFPYALPFQIFSDMETAAVWKYAAALAIETAAALAVEISFLRVRRMFT